MFSEADRFDYIVLHCVPEDSFMLWSALDSRSGVVTLLGGGYDNDKG